MPQANCYQTNAAFVCNVLKLAAKPVEATKIDGDNVALASDVWYVSMFPGGAMDATKKTLEKANA